MSKKNKHKLNRLPTQPVRMGNETTSVVEPTITVDATDIKTETIDVPLQLITEPVINNVAPATLPPVESKNIRHEYVMVSIRGDSTVFQSQVTSFLNDGWKLAGGVATSMYIDGYTATPIWSQALTKEFSN